MARMSRRSFLGALGAGLSALPLVSRSVAGATRAKNVLFIAVDDLRPQLGCYGDPVVQSPNLDRLASQSTLFTRAYCQQAVCSPSRTSLLTGRRPDTTRVYDLETHFRDTIPDVVTLPQQFKNHGFHSCGFSKIYHGGLDDAASWSTPWWKPSAATYPTPATAAALKKRRQEALDKGMPPKVVNKQVRGPAWAAPDVDDEVLADGKTAAEAVRVLREIKDEPFFLAVGFLKPHLPFVAPKRYWDLYREEDIKLASNPFAPKDAPDYALSTWGELRKYEGMPKQGPVTGAQARNLIHGYFACTTYVDAQIGKLLDELDRLGLRDSTAIVVWGDHGWQLGEHGLWCKHTNFETSTHAMLMASAPGQEAPGAKCDALVEFVDIYPTLCDLCGVPKPEGLEGDSFARLLDKPGTPWKPAAFSQYPRGVKGVGRIMGYSMRTARYRFTEWRGVGNDFRGYELYDHDTDPDENVNVVNLPENQALVGTLKEQLEAGWQAARPKA